MAQEGRNPQTNTLFGPSLYISPASMRRGGMNELDSERNELDEQRRRAFMNPVPARLDEGVTGALNPTLASTLPVELQDRILHMAMMHGDRGPRGGRFPQSGSSPAASPAQQGIEGESPRPPERVQDIPQTPTMGSTPGHTVGPRLMSPDGRGVLMAPDQP